MAKIISFDEEVKIVESIQNGRFILNKKFRQKFENSADRTMFNVTCTQCNNTFDVARTTFMRNTKHETGGCRFCSKRSVSRDDILCDLANIKQDYEVLTDENLINNRKMTISVKHLACGYEFESNIETIVKRKPCRRCSKVEKINEEQLVRYINDNGLPYKLVNFNNSKNVHDKVTLQHIDDSCVARGMSFDMTINNFKNKKQRCPYCKCSHGELRIKNYLDEKGIDYKMQYKDENCVSKRLLPFDFFTGNTVLEFDGEQHFSIDGHFVKTQEDFDYRKSCDIIKNDWCRENGYNLVRISYKELDNVEAILDDLFSGNLEAGKIYNHFYYYNSESKEILESGMYETFFKE